MLETEGYTYQRCDRYTVEEFKTIFTQKGCKVPSRNCLEYIAQNPKKIYNTDDEIAVIHMTNPVGRLPRGTTKCYERKDDSRMELRPNDMNRRDPLLEINRRYDYEKRRIGFF